MPEIEETPEKIVVHTAPAQRSSVGWVPFAIAAGLLLAVFLLLPRSDTTPTRTASDQPKPSLTITTPAPTPAPSTTPEPVPAPAPAPATPPPTQQ